MASKSSKVFRVSGAMRAFGPPQLVLFCALSALAVLILSPRGVDQAEAAAEPLLGRPVRLLDMMGTAPHNVAEPHRPVPSASLASASYDATRITYLEGDMTMTPEDATPDILDRLVLELYAFESPGVRKQSPCAHLPVTAMTEIGPGAAAWHYRSEPLPAGDYVAELRPLGLLAPVHLEADGGWLQLHLPTLARTTLRLRDEFDLGIETPAARAHLATEANEGLQPAPFLELVHAREAGTLEIVSLPGTLQLETARSDFHPFYVELELRSGANAHTVRLERSYELLIEAYDGPDVRAFQSDWWLRTVVEPLDCGGKLLAFGLIAGREGVRALSLRLSTPGRYRLHLPALPGREAGATLVADVRARGANACRYDAGQVH